MDGGREGSYGGLVDGWRKVAMAEVGGTGGDGCGPMAFLRRWAFPQPVPPSAHKREGPTAGARRARRMGGAAKRRLGKGLPPQKRPSASQQKVANQSKSKLVLETGRSLFVSPGIRKAVRQTVS